MLPKYITVQYNYLVSVIMINTAKGSSIQPTQNAAIFALLASQTQSAVTLSGFQFNLFKIKHMLILMLHRHLSLVITDQI